MIEVLNGDSNEAVPGERIYYLYYGQPAEGVVRMVLVNSVIVSVLNVDKSKIKQVTHDETVVAHKHYSILNS